MASFGRPPRSKDRRGYSAPVSGANGRTSSSGSSARRSTSGSTGRSTSQPAGRWRSTANGREHELIAIGLIAAGLLLGLDLYFQLAGPVGRGVDTILGWLEGVGRYVLPFVLISIGWSFLRKGHSDHRFRLIAGWVIVGVGLLGILHIVRGPDGIGSGDELGKGGGILGAVIGEPLRSLLASGGGLVLLTALVLCGIIILTGLSVSELIDRLFHVGSKVGNAARPVGRAAKRKFGELSTLNSEREASGEHGRPPPHVYDADSEEAPTPRALPVPKPPSKRKGPVDLPPPNGPPSSSSSPGAQGELALGPGASADRWKLPPLTFLARSANQAVNKAEVEIRGRVLEESLASHGVDVKLAGQTVGPTVTRFELELGPGVKVAAVTSLQRDIAYAMAATDVRILAPIPGRSAIGVEVPNHTRQLVALGDLFASPEARAATHPLDVAIGKDIAGRSIMLNLATTPHLLIAGATGAGKSSAINCIITSMLMRDTPEQVRLILVDPKQVEMGQYNRLPHLLTQPVTNPKKAANALGWAVKEMERRYDLLFEVGFRDIAGYNAAFDRGDLVGEPGSDTTYERLPYIVVVVDELNDLMMVAARDVEDSITRIAQKARAVGIHLIVATQRPSVNVITGVIKANIPARIAFAVSSQTDSRVILDQPGAEKLIGKGDMLLLPGNSNVAARIQGAFVSEEEVRKVVAHWRRQAPEVTYVSGIEGDDGPGGMGGAGAYGNGDDEDEALVRQAMDLVVRSQLGSTSMLQRKLKVGFARAGRIMDLLEQRGVVGPSEGSKARAVLMTVTELDLLQEAENR
jgi:S-DNA-T family DNA segregation ATPase FtsK/SpoIIIE